MLFLNYFPTGSLLNILISASLLPTGKQTYAYEQAISFAMVKLPIQRCFIKVYFAGSFAIFRFSKRGRPYCWIFRNSKFSLALLYRGGNMRHRAIFCGDRSSHVSYMQKWRFNYFQMAAVRATWICDTRVQKPKKSIWDRPYII